MPDAYHLFGNDLQLLSASSSSDLQIVDGISQVAQRLYRRLLTNPGAYPGHADYGGGLGAFVGSPADAGQIQAVVLQQCLLEADVSQNPAPTVMVTKSANGLTTAQIDFVDASSGTAQTLSIPLT